MNVEIEDDALEELKYFQRYGDKKILSKIKKLVEELELHPETGTGKPERLKGDLSGFWSRRINKEHRIVYKIDIEEELVYIYSIKGHYEK